MAGVLEALCKKHDLDLVVLFGSRAKGGGAGGRSDSDIGVRCRTGAISAREFLDLIGELSDATGLPDVDLVDLRRAPPLLKHVVGSEGKLLYEAEPGLFNIYRVYAWKLWLDDRLMLRHLDARYIREGIRELTQ